MRVVPLGLLVVLLAACGADPGQTRGEPVDGRARDEAAAAGGSDGRATPGPTDRPGDAAAEQVAPGEPDGQTARGAGLRVVTPLFPLAWITEELAPAADVRFLLAGGGDPHDLELSPAERELLEIAEVVAYAGQLDFMPQFESAVGSATGEVVDLASVAGEERIRRLGDDDDPDAPDGHDDHGGDHDDPDAGSGGHGHDGEEADPHLWFDSTVMADAAVAIGDALATADPDDADDHREAAAAMAARMDELAEQIDARLSACTHDTVIVSHEAYGYLLEPRGFSQEGISGAGGHGEASPQRLAELSERIAAEDVPAVAAEPLHGRDDAEALAAEAGVEVVEINPLEDVSTQEYERGYPRMLLDQVEAFATALACEGTR